MKSPRKILQPIPKIIDTTAIVCERKLSIT